MVWLVKKPTAAQCFTDVHFTCSMLVLNWRQTRQIVRAAASAVASAAAHSSVTRVAIGLKGIDNTESQQSYCDRGHRKGQLLLS
eukprot:20626-Heterococcus_DN1.PRE.2